MNGPDSRLPPLIAPKGLAVAVALCLGGCKPADEPMRRGARSESESPALAPSAPPPAPPTDEDFRVDLPPPPPTPPPSSPTPAPEPPAPEAPTPADAVQALLRPVSPADEARARKLNTAGLNAHRRRDFEAAITSYQEALEAWPAHVLARYNLACAEALRGAPERAMEELRLLQALGEAGVDIQRALDKARTDEDFRALRTRDDFRTLTGRSEILLAFAAGDPAAEESARRALQALSDAYHPARLAMLDADTLAEGVDLQAATSDAVAASMAPKIASIVGTTRTRLVDRTAGGEAPIVISFRSRASSDAPEAPIAVVPQPDAAPAAAATNIEDLFGVRLTAREETRTHQLVLKATGFFDWTITEAGGAVEKRIGRYRTTGAVLALTFRATRSGGDPSAPSIETTEGLSAEHPVRVEAGALHVGALEFRR